MPAVDRRRFLAGAGALVAGAGMPPLRRQGARSERFPWGVASFDPSPAGILLWTRVTGGPAGVPLRWSLAADEALAEVVAEGEVTAVEATGHCVTVAVDDLPAGRRWWYRFWADDGATSALGRTRTLPDDPTVGLRLGVASCSRYAAGGFAAYGALAERDLDLVVHLGDYIYEDGGADVRAHDPPTELLTLAQYRARYAQHRLDPALQALHARHPMVAVWDDHEIAGNAWRDGAAAHDPATDGLWLDRLLAAGQAHEEWLPGRTTLIDDGRPQLWRALSLGPLARLVVLDTRSWGRDRQPATAAELAEPRSLLGADQQRFVADQLQRPEGGPPWVLLANQVMLHPLHLPAPGSARAALEDAGFLVVDGQALNPDQWDGYPTARDELLAAVGATGGVVALTGDVHSSWAWEGPGRDEDGEPSMVELVTPSVSAASLADRLPVPAEVVETALAALDDDLAYVELSHHGFLLVDLDGDRVHAEWWHVDPDRPGSQQWAAGVAAPRATPMHLRAQEAALPERPPPTTTTTTTTPTNPAAGADDDRGIDDGVGAPAVAVGAGALAAAAAAVAALSLRRRRWR